MKISKKSGELLLLPDYWSFVGANFFYPFRCLMCSDGICELADISFGDAWLPEYSDEKIGKSIIILKNELIEELLQTMNIKYMIKLEKICDKKVIQSQAGMLYFKKKNLNLYGMMFRTVPTNDYLLQSDIVDYLLAFFLYLNSFASSNAFFRKLLHYIPSRFISLYFLPFNLLVSKKARWDLKKIK
jgi:hypothetical protein